MSVFIAAFWSSRLPFDENRGALWLRSLQRRGIPRLALRREAVRLADDILRKGALPAKARVDALHVGVAATHGVDYLLTWNLRHLANASIRGKIEDVVRDADLVPPIICTPEELMEPKL